MSLIKRPVEIAQARRIIVSGPPGSGKTTLSVSASDKAHERLPAEKPCDCDDVVILLGDTEGELGPIDCGMTPLVADFTGCSDWSAYTKQLAAVVKEIAASETIKYVVVDAALPSKLMVDEIKPGTIADWGKVSAQGLLFYKHFSGLRGKTIILNAQVKPTQAAVESEAAKQATEAKAIGGERATFTLDLPKGIASPWIENSSLMVARSVKKVKNPTNKDAPPERVFSTHTSASGRFETKSRFNSKLAATVPGDWTLNYILQKAYAKSNIF